MVDFEFSAEKFFKQERFRKALRFYRKVPESELTVDGMIHKAYCLSYIGKYGESDELFAKVFTEYPDSLGAHYFFGRSFINRSIWNKVEKEAKFLLSKDDSYPGGHLLNASVKNYNRQCTEALDELEIVLRLDPENYRAHHIKGIVFHNQKRFKESVAEFKTVYQMERSAPHLLRYLSEYQLVHNKKIVIFLVLLAGYSWVTHKNWPFMIFAVNCLMLGVLDLFNKKIGKGLFWFLMALLCIYFSF